MELNKENIKAIISLRNQLSNKTFDDSYKQIEALTNNIFDCVQRAQYRLYAAFCIYNMHLKGTPIPNQILQFHKDLYCDINDFFSRDFFSRWMRFRSPNFLKALRYASRGDENLKFIIEVISIPEPTIRNIIPILKENPTKTDLLDQMKLPFLSNVPTISSKWSVKYKLI